MFCGCGTREFSQHLFLEMSSSSADDGLLEDFDVECLFDGFGESDVSSSQPCEKVNELHTADEGEPQCICVDTGRPTVRTPFLILKCP